MSNQQPKVISREEFEKMLTSMTPVQAISNFEALIKMCLQAGIFKEPAEILASDRAINVLANMISAYQVMEKQLSDLSVKAMSNKTPLTLTPVPKEVNPKESVNGKEVVVEN